MDKKLTYLDFNEAVQKSLNLVNKQKLTQKIHINEALNKVLSKDIISVKNLPSFNNSAMDGFAFKIEDIKNELSIKETIFAGSKEEIAKLDDNECYKIMTGAKVPNCVDTIVPIEYCELLENKKVKILKDLKKGSNLRLKGEEKRVGETLLRKGEILKPSSIALLASQGIVMIEVYKEPSIIVLSTGDELKEPWENSCKDEIYNCNSYALISILKSFGFSATYGGVIPDNLEKTIEFINELKKYDVIITTGGISLGDADFVAEAFVKNGLETAFHGVNVKPGKPIMMGKMDHTLVISLPGNPLTAMINCYLLVVPVLKKFEGGEEFYYDTTLAKNKKEFKIKQGRVNIVLGRLENGIFTVTRDNKYGSGMISALYESNALLVTSENCEIIKENSEVKIILFNSSFTNKKAEILN